MLRRFCFFFNFISSNGLSCECEIRNSVSQIVRLCETSSKTFQYFPLPTDLNFDTKPSPSGQNENILSQPRASSTSPQQQYSFSNSTSGSNFNAEQTDNPSSNNLLRTQRNSNASSVSSSTSPTSPVISVNSSSNSSTSTPATGSNLQSRRSSQTHDGRPISKSSSVAASSSRRTDEMPSVHDKMKPKRFVDHIELTNSECDCSDDETISRFTKEYMKTSPTNDSQIRQSNEPEPGPSGNSSNLPSGVDEKPKGDSSNTSSFEELASGTSNGDWLFITKPTVDELATDTVTNNTECTQPSNEDSNTSSNINLTHLTFQNAASHSSQLNIHPSTSLEQQQRVRRLVRRRSDSSINNSSGSKWWFADGVVEEEPTDVSEEETLRTKRSKTSSCDKCGKSKRSLKRHVAKFKRQLETTNASEVEIKKQLEAFLEYLETCQKNSMEGTDSESNDDQRNDGNVASSATSHSVAMDAEEIVDLNRLNDVDDDDDDNYDFEYDEGIHVYGTDHDETKGTPRQFVNINDYENRYV